jgi:hypothetical protein
MSRRTPEDEEEWNKECKRLAYNPDDDAEELTIDERIQDVWNLLKKIATYLDETRPSAVHGFNPPRHKPCLTFEVDGMGISASVFPVIIPEYRVLTAMTMTASEKTIDKLLTRVIDGLSQQVAMINNRQEEATRKEEDENARNAT